MEDRSFEQIYMSYYEDDIPAPPGEQLLSFFQQHHNTLDVKTIRDTQEGYGANLIAKAIDHGVDLNTIIEIWEQLVSSPEVRDELFWINPETGCWNDQHPVEHICLPGGLSDVFKMINHCYNRQFNMLDDISSYNAYPSTLSWILDHHIAADGTIVWENPNQFQEFKSKLQEYQVTEDELMIPSRYLPNRE